MTQMLTNSPGKLLEKQIILILTHYIESPAHPYYFHPPRPKKHCSWEEGEVDSSAAVEE